MRNEIIRIYNYDNERLTAEVLADLDEFGDDYKVIAVYSNFGGDKDFIYIFFD